MCTVTRHTLLEHTYRDLLNDIINCVKFLNFKKNLKVGLSAMGKMYIVCALMENAHTILYGSVTTEYFDINPPTLDDYFI